MSIQLKDIDFVYFDLDDTLLDHRGAQDGAIARLLAIFPDHFERTTATEAQRVYADVNRDVWRRYEAGDIEKSELVDARFGGFLRALGVEGLSGAVVGKAYMDEYVRGGWRMLGGALPAFLRVSRTRPVGIITNGFLEVQRSKLAFYPVLRSVSRSVIIGEEIGMMKPDQALFDVARRRAGVAADRIMHIGDSLESDVRGAARAGWRAVWYGGGNRAEPGALNLDDWDSFCR